MILITASLILSILIVWTTKCYYWLRARRTLKKDFEKAVLVIAHPDDETMFFGPFLMSMWEMGVQVRVLCLSNGMSFG